MIIRVYGYQDTGKTALVEELVRALVKKGYRVASVKHTTHAQSVDTEGKDTWRHWMAGSDPVVFMSKTETSIIKHSASSEDGVVDLLLREFRPDIVVIEGNKEGGHRKVRMGDTPKKPGTVMSNPSMKRLLAYVEDEVAIERAGKQLPGLDCGKCGLDCDRLAKAIAEGRRKLADCNELSEMKVEVVVGGERIATGKFVSEVIDSTVRGMLSSMKGYRPGKEVEIRLSAKNAEAKRRKKGA